MDDRLRICFVAHLFWPDIGGAQARAEKQARHLQALGHEVIITSLRLDRRWKRTETHEGLPIVRVGGVYTRKGLLRAGRFGHLVFDIGMFLRLWRLRHSYDVIHIFQLLSLASAATLVGQITHKPVVISIACEGPSEVQLAQLQRGAMLLPDTLTDTSFLTVDPKHVMLGEIAFLPRLVLGSAILHYIRRSNAFYQVLSTRCHSYLTTQGFRAEQIIHIPGSVDTQKFRPAPKRRPDPARPERDIICVARLDYSKGIDVLLHAWGRMLHAPAEWRAHLKPRLRIVGDGAFRAQMEYIVAELGIAESVEFLGLRRDIADLLQPAWAFVLPSRWEGMPNALLEAMACGLPCVATRVSGSEDIISDGINGLLVEPEQPAELAKVVRRIIEDADLAQRLGKEGRVTVVRDYQLVSVVEQCVALYRRLIRSSKRGNSEAKHEHEIPLQVGARERGE
jgi:glycosyltransferase involved in cell wall biosynthesis